MRRLALILALPIAALIGSLAFASAAEANTPPYVICYEDLVNRHCMAHAPVEHPQRLNMIFTVSGNYGPIYAELVCSSLGGTVRHYQVKWHRGSFTRYICVGINY